MKLTKQMLKEIVKKEVSRELKFAADQVLTAILRVAQGDISAREAMKSLKAKGIWRNDVVGLLTDISNKLFGEHSAEMSPILDFLDWVEEEKKYKKAYPRAEKMYRFLIKM